MKKYIIKNYKGNLVESLKNFSKKYKGMRITEAKAEGDTLKIKADSEGEECECDKNISEALSRGMTVRDIQKNINKFASEHSDLLDEPTVIDGGWLCIGHFDKEEDDWVISQNVTVLPRDTGAKY